MRLLISIIFLFFFCDSFGQDSLTGKWYTFSSDIFKVVEYNFDNKSIVTTQLDWNLIKHEYLQTAHIIKIVEQNENLYYLLKDDADTSIISLSIFSSVKLDSCFMLLTASDTHTNFGTTQEALAFIQVDTFKRVGLTFYSEKEFKKLRLLPDPLTITREKYKLYLQRLINERQKIEDFSSIHKDEIGFMFFDAYTSNKARTVLVDVGYNPIIDDKYLRRVNDKFKNDTKLKPLIDKALKIE